MITRITSPVALLLIISIFGIPSLSQAKPLKLACYDDYYPYAAINEDGDEIGVVADFWMLWSQKTGTPIEFVPLHLQDAMKAVQTGKADALCGVFYTEERAEKLTFSDALIRMETFVFVANRVKAQTIGELTVPVGVVKGDFAVQFLKEHHPNTKLKVFPSYGELQHAVQNDLVHAFVYDYPRALPGLKQMDAPKGYKKLQVLYSERLRAAVKRTNIKLLEEINAGLSKITDQELWQLSQKWEFYRTDNTQMIVGLSITITLLLALVALLIYIWTLRSRLRLSKQNPHTDWMAIIKEGENDFVEFKSTMRWDIKQQKINKVLEQVIAKTISAFLNTQGGRLFVGVDDDGEILGLEDDYNSFSKKKNRDGFLLALSSLINKSIGKKFHRYITVNMEQVDGKEICIITLKPADSPAFLLSGNKEEFYIRAQASSQPLGLKDTHEYISSKWAPK